MSNPPTTTLDPEVAERILHAWLSLFLRSGDTRVVFDHQTSEISRTTSPVTPCGSDFGSKFRRGVLVKNSAVFQDAARRIFRIPDGSDCNTCVFRQDRGQSHQITAIVAPGVSTVLEII